MEPLCPICKEPLVFHGEGEHPPQSCIDLLRSTIAAQDSTITQLQLTTMEALAQAQTWHRALRKAAK